MPKIIPIRDLKNTTALSALCHEVDEPVYVTKNGYSDLVIMSSEVYDKAMFMQEVFMKLSEAEVDIAEGNTRSIKNRQIKIGREPHRLNHKFNSSGLFYFYGFPRSIYSNKQTISSFLWNYQKNNEYQV